MGWLFFIFLLSNYNLYEREKREAPCGSSGEKPTDWQFNYDSPTYVPPPFAAQERVSEEVCEQEPQ